MDCGVYNDEGYLEIIEECTGGDRNVVWLSG